MDSIVTVTLTQKQMRHLLWLVEAGVVQSRYLTKYAVGHARAIVQHQLEEELIIASKIDGAIIRSQRDV